MNKIKFKIALDEVDPTAYEKAMVNFNQSEVTGIDSFDELATYGKPSVMLQHAFSWGDTPEGVEYWAGVTMDLEDKELWGEMQKIEDGRNN